MKRFLSISFCLMLCLTSIFVFGACEKKPKQVSEVQAMSVLGTALGSLETADVIEIECDNFMFMGEFVTVISENIEYSSFMGIQSWAVYESDYWYEYTITPPFFDGGETTYTKSLVILEDEEDDDFDPMSMIFDTFDKAEFSKASLLGDEYSITFKVVEEGEATNMTFIVENNKLEEIVIGSMGISITFEFEFGLDALLDIPQLPTSITWDVYEPYIEVEGLKEYYELGETIELEDLTILFYEDDSTYLPEEYMVTSDMISGFVSNEVNSGTIIVTFYGLTFEQSYTCK